jgi:hypothetical protein
MDTVCGAAAGAPPLAKQSGPHPQQGNGSPPWCGTPPSFEDEQMIPAVAGDTLAATAAAVPSAAIIPCNASR